MEENEIYETTGCLSSCVKSEYKMQALSEITTKVKYSPNLFKIKMVFKTGRYNEKKQFLIYDFNSLTADIGGFLGLLLGYSLLSIYNAMVGQLIIWSKAY
jgi:hypothetical protein